MRLLSLVFSTDLEIDWVSFNYRIFMLSLYLLLISYVCV